MAVSDFHRFLIPVADCTRFKSGGNSAVIQQGFLFYKWNYAYENRHPESLKVSFLTQ
jgi:hypothetical protein